VADYRIFTVYAKRNLLRAQRWWITIDHANGNKLFRSTEGLANRVEAIKQALAVAKPNDRIRVEHRGQLVTWVFETAEWLPSMLKIGQKDT